MFKRVSVLCFFLSCLLLVSCGGGESGVQRFTLTEDNYVVYINELYTNYVKYTGATVTLEGMYSVEHSEYTGQDYCYVYRIGPGCCGNDGTMCGFEFLRASGDVPSENDWISVTGTLSSYVEEGYTYLTLNNAEVTVKTERGAETVK